MPVLLTPMWKDLNSVVGQPSHKCHWKSKQLYGRVSGLAEGLPIAEPRVKNSRVKLVTSEREEEALQTGGVPSSFCRLTSDQGMPAPTIK